MYLKQAEAENVRKVIQYVARKQGLVLKNADNADLFEVDNLSKAGIMLEFDCKQLQSRGPRRTVDAVTIDANGADVGVAVHWAQEGEEDVLVGVEIFSRYGAGVPAFPIRVEQIAVF